MTQFTKTILLVTCVLALVSVSACDKSNHGHDEEHAEASAPEEHAADEHAADEHAADEHAADEHAADEHAADEHAADEQVGQSPTSLDELPEGVNVVQNEMQLLTEAMQTTLVLIANDQLEGIPAQIKKVHPAKVLTHKAIKKGVYAPPKNAEKIDEFVALDDAFHDDLRGLLEASKKDDLQMATDKYGDLVQGCTSCHTKFRY
jgi:hypothetical protein